MERQCVTLTDLKRRGPLPLGRSHRGAPVLVRGRRKGATTAGALTVASVEKTRQGGESGLRLASWRNFSGLCGIVAILVCLIPGSGVFGTGQ